MRTDTQKALLPVLLAISLLILLYRRATTSSEGVSEHHESRQMMSGPTRRSQPFAIAVRLLVAAAAIAATVAFTYCLLYSTAPTGDSTTPDPRPPSISTEDLGERLP
ncbi:hypothetical protein [Nocardia sp. NBC_00403]|uniref:hypothetical protein n=1 Tax=Nocardia sp. NBC_00403 TaxID=2975990 RepID=UPI002E241036